MSSAPQKQNKLVLFDVDGTLSLARQDATPEMIELLRELRGHVDTGFVGGSNLVKIQEQLGVSGNNVTKDFDYGFAENGLIAYHNGEELPSESFINWYGEEKYKELVKFCLHYIADLDIPIMRGTFIEFRRGMINVSPLGRNASTQERNEFEAFDNVHKIRQTFIEALKKNFPGNGLNYSIGGQISFDIFPVGWDKTFCLRHVEHRGYDEIHFFGDKTMKGGNDYEIYEDPRTIGHSVKNPGETMQLLMKLFGVGAKGSASK